MSVLSKNLRKKARRHWYETVYADQNGRCAMCGHSHVLTLHHMVALEDGGPNERSNLLGLCRSCHMCWHGFGDGCKDSRWRPLHDFVHVTEAAILPTRVDGVREDHSRRRDNRVRRETVDFQVFVVWQTVIHLI